MSESPVIPFWGPEQVDLLGLMTQAIDPEQRISSAMQAVAPLDGRVLLDVGANAQCEYGKKQNVTPTDSIIPSPTRSSDGGIRL